MLMLLKNVQEIIKYSRIQKNVCDFEIFSHNQKMFTILKKNVLETKNVHDFENCLRIQRMMVNLNKYLWNIDEILKNIHKVLKLFPNYFEKNFTDSKKCLSKQNKMFVILTIVPN